MEQKALEAEKKLCDIRPQLQEAEQRVMMAEQRAAASEQREQLAEERAKHAEQAVQVAQKRAGLAEESVAELERKLFETENDLDELLECRELVEATRGMSLESVNAQQELCHSSNGSLKILGHSCNSSLSGFFMTHDEQQQQQGDEVLDTEGDSHCNTGGDELSITSL